MKEVDAQLNQKATKEAISATESMKFIMIKLLIIEKVLDILEMTFSQLGEKFASKPQTSEAIFKLKS